MSDPIEQLNNIAKDKLLAHLTKAHDDGVSAFMSADNIISEAASHDFTSYEFLYEPVRVDAKLEGLTYDEQELFRVAIMKAIGDEVQDEFFEVYRDGESGGADYDFWSRSQSSESNDEALAKRLFDTAFVNYILPEILDTLSELSDVQRVHWLDAFRKEIYNITRAKLAADIHDIVRERDGFNLGLQQDAFNAQFDGVLTDAEYWTTKAKAQAKRISEGTAASSGVDNRTRTYGEAKFSPFVTDTVNFGLQLVFRQVWTPLGTQTGEIVRTIPLGPGQTEKISVKTVSRSKSTRRNERMSDQESSSDITTTSRDSSEVVSDASERFGWGTEVSAEGNWGWGKASVSGSLSGEKSSNSRDAKTNMNEAMSKSADKLRVQTKMIVSTELSMDDEQSQVSEIKNLNDEVAVTYVYSKLQRRYKIHTYLAEVNTVTYVAAPVPRRVELNYRWFGRNAHILRHNIMDSRYLQDLDMVLQRSSGHRTEQAEPSHAVDSNLSRIVKGLANGGLPDHSESAGSPPDLVSTALNLYDREIERSREEKFQSSAYQSALERLQDHIIDHALYYARAIWNAEDGDARIMRYANVRVPTEFKLVRTSQNYDATNGTGVYVPSNDAIDSMARLSELLNPAGPIGYAGNYLAFYARGLERYPDLDQPLRAMRAAYLERFVTCNDSDNMPISIAASTSPNLAIPAGGLQYVITRILSDNKPQLKLSYLNMANPQSNNETIDFDGSSDIIIFEKSGLKIRFYDDNGLSNVLGSQSMMIRGTINVMSRLEDPELAALKWQITPLATTEEARIFDATLLADMSRRFADTFAERFAPDDIALITRASWDTLPVEIKNTLRYYYPHYLMQVRYERQLLLDTDNLVLTRLVDDSSSIEPFKALHRYIDVLTSIENLELQQQETRRYRKRLASGDFSDPETESHHVVISGGTDVDIDVNG